MSVSIAVWTKCPNTVILTPVYVFRLMSQGSANAAVQTDGHKKHAKRYSFCNAKVYKDAQMEHKVKTYLSHLTLEPDELSLQILSVQHEPPRSAGMPLFVY